MRRFRDQMGRELLLNEKVQRIVSTVPSQTALLDYLGLERETVGITAYCTQPKHWLKEKDVIGGTKDLQIEKIKALLPDLILSNKEENVRQQIEVLAADYPVWLSAIESVEDALAMIWEVGQLTGRSAKADELLKGIDKRRKALPQAPKKIRTAFFIWQDPYMLAGPQTFIHAMLEAFGLENAVPAGSERYPVYSEAEIMALDLDLILLSSEPYAFTTKDLHRVSAWAKKSKMVDGSFFSWYGPRMLPALDYGQRLLAELRMVFG